MEININFECGERTCHSFPGVHCIFLTFKNFGNKPFCNLFEQKLSQEFGVGTLRCQECLNLSLKDNG